MRGWGGRIRTLRWWIGISGDEQPLANVRSKADTPVRDQAVNRLSNEQLSCSELTGFRVCSEHCCGAWSGCGRLRGLALPGVCPGGAEVVRRMASHELQRIP